MNIKFSRFSYQQYVDYRELGYKLSSGRNISRFFSSIGVFFCGKTISLSKKEKEKIMIEDNNLYNKLSKYELLNRSVIVCADSDQYNDDDFHETPVLIDSPANSNKDLSTELDTSFSQADDQHCEEILPDAEIITEILNDSTPDGTNHEPFVTLKLGDKKSCLEESKLLPEGGATVKNSDDNEMTPFSRAVESGNIEIVKTLLESGADPNSIEKNMMPIVRAIRNDDYTMIKCLLEGGADINMHTDIKNEKSTALEEAVRTKNSTMLEFLLENGAIDIDIDIEADYSYMLNLSKEIKVLRMEIVKYSLSIYHVELRGMTDTKTMVLSIQHSHSNLDLFLTTLKATKNPSALYIILRMAITNNKIDIINLLLDRLQIDINFRRSTSCMTLLELAASTGNCPIIRTLIEKGANINSTSNFPSTHNPLIYATRENHVDAIFLLLNKGVNHFGGINDLIDIPNPDGVTPLTAIEEASKNGFRHIVRALMVYSTQLTRPVLLSYRIRRQCYDRAIWNAALHNHLGIIKDLCVYASLEIKDVTHSDLLLECVAKKGYRDILNYMLINKVTASSEEANSLIMTNYEIDVNERSVLTLQELSIVAFVKGNGLKIKDVYSKAMKLFLPKRIMSMIRNCHYLCLCPSESVTSHVQDKKSIPVIIEDA
ncbi:MAG: ankyrin repeat domain-containing protein [Endozoicomonadaceae bacterium]|nr:ankyrin repeat domain-containing protein [Endozoicomonadaceae bacterium]